MIPFIIGAIAVGAGAYGVKKGFDAREDMNEARKINKEAKDLVADTESRIDNARQSTNALIEQLGKMKIQIMSGSLNAFVENFSRLKNVEINDNVGLEELRGFNPDSKDFLEIKDSTFKAKELAAGGLGGIAAGTLLAVGAFKAGTLIGVASTGTAIAGLSGAVATNATLAWLGGGALSAGGFGIAGGMAVLGGIVAGPALAIGGAFIAAKAEKVLNNARLNSAKALHFSKEGDKICTSLKDIQNRGLQINDLLLKLNNAMAKSAGEIEIILEYFGTDWKNFNLNAKRKIGIAAQIAQAIKTVIDTPLLTEDGNLNDAPTKNALKIGNSIFD